MELGAFTPSDTRKARANETLKSVWSTHLGSKRLPPRLGLAQQQPPPPLRQQLSRPTTALSASMPPLAGGKTVFMKRVYADELTASVFTGVPRLTPGPGQAMVLRRMRVEQAALSQRRQYVAQRSHATREAFRQTRALHTR